MDLVRNEFGPVQFEKRGSVRVGLHCVSLLDCGVLKLKPIYLVCISFLLSLFPYGQSAEAETRVYISLGIICRILFGAVLQ